LTLYNGEDQRPIRKNLPEIIEKLNKLHPDSNFYISTIDEVMKNTENNWFSYDTIKGEMTALLRSMSALAQEERPRIGKIVNEARAELRKRNTIRARRIRNK